MKKIFLLALVFLLAFGVAANVVAQDAPYLFSVDKEVTRVYWNSDGTLSLDYTWVFTNDANGHVIDFVDVGMPNGNFSIHIPRPTEAPLPGKTPTALLGTPPGALADVNGNPVSISSDYQGNGSYGFSVDMGAYAIQPGQTGTVHVYVGGITGVLYPDDNDQAYASAVFSPTWFGSQYVKGSTDLTVTFHLPPNMAENEPRWHAAPSGFPAEPSSVYDAENRVTYTWTSPNASAAEQYTFGASFPKSYVPAEAIYVPPPAPGFDSNSIFSLLCCGSFFFIFFGLPTILAVRQSAKRKLQYLPPKVSIEGHGIKRGLTAVESAILMEQPLDKVMTMALFGVIKKNAASVKTRDPLALDVAEPLPEGLNDYELNFLKAFKVADAKARQKELQDTMVALVKSVSEKMRGFSRKETMDYYKAIMEKAWQQVESAGTPEVKSQKFEEALEWTMLDKDYDDRTRRTFSGPVYLPMWWGRYDPTYRPSSSGGSVAPSLPSPGGSKQGLPGADFAASMVTGVQTFSQSVIGNVGAFTEKITGVTNPPPKVSSGGRSGGGGRSCACACACAGCACACAGGGR